MPSVFISRQPLVNRQSKIIANRLTLHFVDGATCADAATQLNALGDCWPQGEKPVFIDCRGATLDARLLDWVAPANVTLEVPSTLLEGEDGRALAAELQAGGASLCLRVEGGNVVVPADLPVRFLAFDARRLSPAELKGAALQAQAHGIGVAYNVFDGAAFKACLDAGLAAAASWFFKHPGTPVGKALNPGQAQIVRVLNLVRKNADVKDIEAALKQDVALSYKLLRYINSAGFGLSCEIQSFRHAVTILGYDKLNKWLSLLLATASKDPMAPALLHTALTRARLMEELSHGLVERQEYDNLFITGAFSLLDLLLGVSMDKVLESMHLPEPISDALLGRGGVYGPFLELAQVSEGEDGALLAERAGMLGLSSEQFNRAQLHALSFADAMEF